MQRTVTKIDPSPQHDPPADVAPSVPLFKRIERTVTEQILTGHYKRGERLPSEAELPRIFQASRQTVNKAISELAKHGLVERNRRAGTVVSWRFQEQFVLPLRDISDEVPAAGKVYEHRILQRRVVLNGLEGITWGALPARARLLFIETLHLSDGLPAQLETRYINLQAVPWLEGETFAELPPSKWLLLNIPWSDVSHAVRATSADEALARALGIHPGAACLVVDRQTFHFGRPIPFAHMAYPGDRSAIRGEFSLSRNGAARG